jgi:hypothetical protein
VPGKLAGLLININDIGEIDDMLSTEIAEALDTVAVGAMRAEVRGEGTAHDRRRSNGRHVEV